MQDNNRFRQPPQSQTIQVPGAALMVKGLKGEYHVNKHQEKLRRHTFDLGIDLYASRSEPKVDELSPSFSQITVSTCLHLVIMPPATMGLIHPRSSSPVLLGGGEVLTGVIDPHYSGEILVLIKAYKPDLSHVLNRLAIAMTGEVAIAQMVICQMAMPVFAQWSEEAAKQLKRGVAGFGSTSPSNGG